MTMLKPLGLISLISLVILLLIYILKPNFQQKFISSTFIWKLSLKYKKKKLPINKLKNILLIICQILILTGLALVLTKPVKILKTVEENEYILILDASASMRTYYEDESRFERAVEKIKEKASDVFDDNGTVSIVLASSKPTFIVERASASSRWEVEKLIDEISLEKDCTYGTADLDKATELCQDILYDNPSVNTIVYTDETVDYIPTGLQVVNVASSKEYNVAILNAYAEIIDNYYSFVVEVACYGRDLSIALNLEVYGANIIEDLMPDGMDFTFDANVDLNNEQTKKVVFINSDIDINQYADDENTIYYQIPETEKIFSYESVLLSIDEDDDYLIDNNYSIYGGTKEVLKVLYASSQSNPFFNGVLLTLQSALSDRLDIQITEYKKGDLPSSGYDLYIYEHEMMPTQAPTDGVVIYADPLVDVANSGFRLKQIVDFNKNSLSLTEEKEHALINNVIADNITVSRYTQVVNLEATYETLMTCDTDPVLLVRNEESVKSIVMLFSLHYSNFALLSDFPLFMFNVFDYFMPATITGNSFAVDDEVQIRSRSNAILVEGNDSKITIEEFPNTLSLSIPGTYTISQTTYFGEDISELIYVQSPAEESNIFNNIETISYEIENNYQESLMDDLIFYLTLALAAFVFLEWLLKGNDAI